MNRSTKRCILSTLCLLLAIAGVKGIASLNTASSTASTMAKAELAVAQAPSDIEVFARDTKVDDESEVIQFGEVPEDIQFAEFETLSEEELAELDWSEAELMMNGEEVLDEVGEEVSTMKTRVWGAKTYINWKIDYKDSAFTSKFTVLMNQAINFSVTKSPVSYAAYAAIVDADLKVHTYSFNSSGSCTVTYVAPKSGQYRVAVMNRTGKILKVTGYYRIGK